jgi:hypothetical protein
MRKSGAWDAPYACSVWEGMKEAKQTALRSKDESIPNWKFNAINLRRANTQVRPYSHKKRGVCRGRPVCLPLS